MQRRGTFGTGRLGMSEVHIDGMIDVVEALNRAVLEIEGYSRKGLIRSVKFLQREMFDGEGPIVPRDTGNLRASFHTHNVHEGTSFGIEYGFYANYALWVHEMADADFTSPKTRYHNGIKRTYTPDPRSGPFFMRAAIDKNFDTILSIIHDSIVNKTNESPIEDNPTP